VEWQSEAFIQLHVRAVCAILSSTALQVRSENTVYCAARRWWRNSPHSPHQSTDSSHLSGIAASKAATASLAVVTQLLETIRYHLLDVNFLMDVVARDESFFVGPNPNRSVFVATLDAYVRTAIEYHASSKKRREVIACSQSLSLSLSLSIYALYI
jgi:hypothetical protein